MTLNGALSPRSLPERPLESPRFQYATSVSLDGRFFAYASRESRQDEVYVRPYPDQLAWREQISTAGGRGPEWSPDGERFAFWRLSQEVPPPALYMILNWFEELKRLVPRER